METDGGVDNSVDQQLLQQFRCMGTTDKDDLVRQLKTLVGNQIPTASAIFLLEMNDWNLQAAVGSYFDIEMPPKVLSMTTRRIDNDSTIFKIAPATPAVKVWSLINNGDEGWPEGCCLQFCGGDLMCGESKFSVPALLPNESTHVMMNLLSPTEPGIYKSEWRMVTPAGAYFGEIIWIIMTVEAEDPSCLAQQLSDLNTSSSGGCTSGYPNPTFNPFHQ